MFQQMGFGVTVALLVATLIRIVTLPSGAQPARQGAAGASRWLRVAVPPRRRLPHPLT